MKKTVKKVLILVVLALLATTVLTACSGQTKKKEYDYLVTFNYNVGNLTTNCKDQYLGVSAGKTVALHPEKNGEYIKEIEVDGYFVEGWYVAKQNSAGEVVIDPETNRVVLDRKWNFDTETVNSDITLYANLLRQVSLFYVDRATGDVLKTDTGKPGAIKNEPGALAPKKNGYTLLGYFVNEEGNEKFSWPYTYGETDGTVYCEFLEGNWTVVNNPRAFTTIGSDAKVYLTADLDFSEIAWVPKTFNGELNGNGHKITGINYTKELTSANDTVGLFISLGANAYVHDLTIEDAQVTVRTVKAGKPVNVAFFAYSVAEGAKLENVTVSGTLSYKNYVAVDEETGKTQIGDIEPFEFVVDNKIKQEDFINCSHDVTIVNLNSQTQE